MQRVATMWLGEQISCILSKWHGHLHVRLRGVHPTIVECFSYAVYELAVLHHL